MSSDKDYPTELDLTLIEKWDLKEQGVLELLEFIESKWWSADWGFNLSGEKILKLQLSTGGWSGNEDIISALRNNFIFWSMYWEVSRKGGHYEFKIGPL